MPISTIADFDELMNRSGNDIMMEMAEATAPLWNELEHKSVEGGGKVVVNIVSPGQAGGGFILDGGSRQAGSNRVPVQGQILPKFVHETVEFNNGVMMVMGGGGDSIDYVEAEVKSAGATLGQHLGQALYGDGGKICNIISASVSGSVLSCVVPDAAGFLEGMAYEIENGTDGYVQMCLLTGITFSSTGFGATLSFTKGVPGFTTAALVDPADTTSAIYARGTFNAAQIDTAVDATKSDANINSLNDVCSTSSTLHDITVASRPDWVGNQFDLNGAAGTQEAVISRLGRVRTASRKMPDLLAVSAGLHTALAASATTVASSAFGLSNVGGHIRKNADATLNKYGKEIFDENKLMIGKTRILLDDNIASDNITGSDGYTSAFLINTDHVKLYEWKKIAPETQSGSKFILDQDSFKTKMFWAGAYNLGTNMRRAHGKMFDIAVSL